MTQDEILRQVQEVIREELDSDSVVVTAETIADDVEDWDSISNIQIIIGIEKKFGIKFTAMQVNSFKNVGEICTCIQSAKA